MKLYDYFRSSAAYRVRIGLNLKGLAYDAVPVHLVRDGGEHLKPEYRAINPSALIPALQDGGATITQSLAILEYLDEVHPLVPILPRDALGRARVRSLALAIACDIHPLNNLRVLRYLVKEAGLTEEAKTAWYVHWVREGFAALEAQLAASADTGRFCHGDMPTLADIVLVPQVFNAARFNVDMSAYPTMARIDAACRALPAFEAAHPAKQADAE
ncbi:maleylacetoacetate isomerase [Massilia sp. PAMC28688]|uniref:maleylacetoacetate isomerase n=1 Tax=Massilia sp. PAMC28688 TaxID=2861283 RepID=UPI001C628CD5|nr:maleylacetoacetate isomerase [Massilia sp. PAMC28688]QYF92343.1 maleylacetoacetate isomerase [Massilia sp. PAMC28688]